MTTVAFIFVALVVLSAFSIGFLVGKRSVRRKLAATQKIQESREENEQSAGQDEEKVAPGKQRSWHGRSAVRAIFPVKVMRV